MYVVTAGSSYMDIDAYAGCVAYAELLRAQDMEAEAISTAPLNESINPTIRSWNAPIKTAYTPSASDLYVMIDVSDPAYFDKIVDLARVADIMDHHVGFEQYWQERLGGNVSIEFIGAACTLVYERWKLAWLFEKMSVLSARLLVCGILDNTLNFGAKVTTSRDEEAYTALIAKADLPTDWPVQYFTACQQAIINNIVNAVQNDKKIAIFKSFVHPVCCGQMAVWNAREVLAKQEQTLQQILASIKPHWFMNLMSVGEKKSYFFTDNHDVQAWLSKLLGVQFQGSVAVADRLWLRKEIIRQDITTTDNSTIMNNKTSS